MFSRSVGLISTCALVASAFVLPQRLQLEGDTSTHTTIDANLHSSLLIRIPCADCTISSLGQIEDLRDDGVVHEGSLRSQADSYDLLLNFTTSNNGKGLELGGARIYPARFFFSSFFNFHPVEVFQIPSREQVRGNTLEGSHAIPLRVTTSKLKVVEHSRKTGSKERVAILQYHIQGLEGLPFHLSPVEVVVVQKKSGSLYLQTTETQPLRVDPASNRQSFSHHAKNPGQGSPHCDMLPGPLCRLFNMFQTGPKCQGGRKGHGAHFKGSSWARLSGHHGSTSDAKHTEKEGEHGRHHHHHQHHHGAHYRHGLLAAFFRGFVAALIPILLGVFVGMTISLVGLVVGNVLSYLWNRVNRSKHTGYVRLDNVPEKDLSVTETADLPPQYSDHLSHSTKEKMDG